jgi:hypothetical protein
MVKLRVKNVSDEPITFSDENQALIDTKGKTYSPDDEAWIDVDDSDPLGEINPATRLKQLCRSMSPSARSLTTCC